MEKDFTNLNIRIDRKLKEDADQVCGEIGLTLSAAINIYFRKIVREKRIPFELSIDPAYETKDQNEECLRRK